MSGYPTRPSLAAFGPTMVNRARVVDPTKDLGADLVNLVRWQLAGLGQCAPLAWLLAAFTGPSIIAIAAQGNAWQGAAPTIARTSAGFYVVTYLPTYPDENGNAQPINLLAASVSPQSNTPRLRGDWSIANGRVVTVNLFDKTDAATDGSFFAAFY